MTDNFFSICPRNKEYLQYIVESIPLRVIQEKDIVVEPDLNINVSDLNNGYKHFFNNGSKADTFKVSVIIHKDDVVNGISTSYTATQDSTLKVIDILDYLIRNMIPVMVYTDAIDIKDNILYIITNNSSRTQTYKDYTVWDLEFTTYTQATIYTYANNNTAVQKAIAKNKKKNDAKKNAKKNAKTTKKASTNQSKLSKCKRSKLVYSKKQKDVKCVRYLQKILKNHKYYKRSVDGWFGKYTKEALKKFQKKYKKKYKIKSANGKVDKQTFKALCGA